jgi:hypothetical protein
MLIFLSFLSVCSWQMNTHIIESKKMCYMALSGDFLFLSVFVLTGASILAKLNLTLQIRIKYNTVFDSCIICLLLRN